MKVTYCSDGPKCPHCGFTFTPDEAHYYDPSGYTRDTCPECKQGFKVEVHHSVSWECEPLACT